MYKQNNRTSVEELISEFGKSVIRTDVLELEYKTSNDILFAECLFREICYDLNPSKPSYDIQLAFISVVQQKLEENFKFPETFISCAAGVLDGDILNILIDLLNYHS